MVNLIVEGLERVQGLYPWNHNEHYHRWILGNLPERRGRALDVGCGTGLLLRRLAPHFDQVVGIDPNQAMVAEARVRLADRPHAAVERTDLADYAPAPPGFDLVTLVASLHHQSLGPALEDARRLLAPGGRLLIVGLWNIRLQDPADLALALATWTADPVVGFVKYRRGRRGPKDDAGMPVSAPFESWPELKAGFASAFPTASARRRLFFRYTVCWDKP